MKIVSPTSVDSAFVSAGADAAPPEQAASDMVIIDTSAAHTTLFFIIVSSSMASLWLPALNLHKSCRLLFANVLSY